LERRRRRESIWRRTAIGESGAIAEKAAGVRLFRRAIAAETVRMGHNGGPRATTENPVVVTKLRIPYDCLPGFLKVGPQVFGAGHISASALRRGAKIAVRRLSEALAALDQRPKLRLKWEPAKD
jgi:hypothetical protein